MQTIRQFTVDAFAEQVFQGNPAAVCLLDNWLSDELMLKIAQENNLSETAFVIRQGDEFGLRWFTPASEIDLCGHATLATTFVINHHSDWGKDILHFNTLSGKLSVQEQVGLFWLDFPAYELQPIAITDDIVQALGGITPQAVYLGRDLLCVLDSEQQVCDYKPDFSQLLSLDGALLHITAQGKRYDCVSRSFAPKMGVDEDPVCGSGHCHIFPYWAKQLGKSQLLAYQASARGGQLHGQIMGNRVILGGKAVLFAKSEIYIPD